MFDLHEAELEWDVAARDRGLSILPLCPVHPAKALFDLVVCTLLLLPLALIALALVILNPFLNAGPLFYVQSRMGHDCRAFTAYKFRSMRDGSARARGAFDALEHDRIGRLGRILRRTRIDELPQIINVLRGEMSLIGPRPDSYDHACVYLREVPGYAARYRVTPGISGYAQTEVGYVDGPEGIRRKVAADHYYLDHAGLALDLWILWRTLRVVLGAKGS